MSSRSWDSCKKNGGGFLHTHQGHSEKEGIVEKAIFRERITPSKASKRKSIFVGLPSIRSKAKF